jgi:hypothetical protein
MKTMPGVVEDQPMTKFDLSELEGEERAHYAVIVAEPGPFHGEHPSCPYFWDICLDGGYDGDLEGYGLVVGVTPDDRKVFPDLAGTDVVVLDESDVGFVRMRRFTLAEYEKFVNDLPTEPAGEWSIPDDED